MRTRMPPNSLVGQYANPNSPLCSVGSISDHSVTLKAMFDIRTILSSPVSRSEPALPEAQTLFCAGLRAGIGNAGDYPFSLDAYEVEQVCSTVIDLPIHQKVEGRPHNGEIVIDPNKWIVNAFFNLCRTGSTYALREGFKRHLRGLAVAHQHHRATWQRGRLDRRGISL